MVKSSLILTKHASGDGNSSGRVPTDNILNDSMIGVVDMPQSASNPKPAEAATEPAVKQLEPGSFVVRLDRPSPVSQGSRV